jgi:hypothetical protein
MLNGTLSSLVCIRVYTKADLGPINYRYLFRSARVIISESWLLGVYCIVFFFFFFFFFFFILNWF